MTDPILPDDELLYGQFCPIAKSFELIGEKWTALILRELLMGARRYAELQRALGGISPALLSKRLVDLERRKLISKRPQPSGRGFEYAPEESAVQLRPILVALGKWGMSWARENLRTEDYDVGLLMTYLQRSLDVRALPQRPCVLSFQFEDMSDRSRWWLLADDKGVDVCDRDPGRDVDVFITTTVAGLSRLWLEGASFSAAVDNDELILVGPSAFKNSIGEWLRHSVFADLPDVVEILKGEGL